MSPRFDYGKTKPWIHKLGEAIEAGAGPSAVELRGHVPLRAHDFHASAEFSIREGEHVGFVLSSHPSWEAYARADRRVRRGRCRPTRGGASGPVAPRTTVRWADEVQRSLITLKALTYAPTGGIVAAATTSLPEFLGGVRNWDYRFCWLRDASLTLDALMAAGYVEEATSWRDWVVRAVAGDPEDIQIMYGLGGERRLDEYELPHLDGYEGSAPVRIGNAASGQLQLDVYGELDRRDLPGARARDAAGSSTRKTVARHVIALARGALAGPGRRRLGGARRSQAVRALEGDGVGRRRPGRQVRGGDGARAGRSTTSTKLRDDDARGDLSRGLRREAQHVHAVLRVDAARRLAAA